MNHRTHIVRLLALMTVLLSLGIFAFAPAAAAPVNVQINFQDAATVPPAGYLRDSGEAYGVRTGANQGGGVYTYGWVNPQNNQPVALTDNGRNRNVAGFELRQNTLIHMQADDLLPGGINPGVEIEGVWEILTDNGAYDVTISAGDAANNFNSVHRLNVESTAAIDFTPTTTSKFRQATVRVNVTDGRLTIDGFGGSNTKINYVIIVPAAGPARPSVLGTAPANNATNVAVDSSITANLLSLPNGGLDGATVNINTVYLYPTGQPGNRVAASSVNTTGGGDAITFVPAAYLTPNTNYTFEITDQVRDGSGQQMLPFTMTFTTGGAIILPPTGVSFTRTALNLPGRGYTSVAVGPDNRLYVTTNTGQIYHWAIQPTGLLTDEQVITALGNRLAIGLAFQPGSTAENPILWVSHNANVFPGPHFTGQISRLTRTNNVWAAELKIDGLPRSVKDHLTNSIEFGPDGALYTVQGSISAMGARDNAWGQQPETLLSAAVLRIDINALPAGTLNVATGTASPDGNLLDDNNFQLNQTGLPYNPRAANAPLTLYATGVRNAYDLVWHSNGSLYVPTNGSAGGGNAPGTPGNFATQPSCVTRANGAAYAGGAVPAAANITTQEDYLFRVVAGGYYGHPNQTRCEWVLNGGNPTAGADPGQLGNHYPVGTNPDPNWRGISYNFSFNKSPNGAIEYRNNTVFGGALAGRLLVVRYSQNDDIIVLQPGGAFNDIVAAQTGIPGFAGFNNPLDLIEHRPTGNLYVVEYGSEFSNTDNAITLLQPGTPNITVDPNPLPLSDSLDGIASAPVQLTITNTGTANLSLNSLVLGGANADQFLLVTPPATPATIAPNGTLVVNVSMNATSAGNKTATLTLNSNDPDTAALVVTLNGTVTGSGTPNIAYAPNTLTFAAQTIGTTSAAQPVVINNTGNATLRVSALTMGGANGAEFQLQNPPTLPLDILANSSATINVLFAPQTAGAKTGALTIVSDDPDTFNAVVALNGTANEPPGNIAAGPTNLNFTDAIGGGASAPQSVTINNTGPGALRVTALNLGGANANEFQIQNPPTLPLDIPANTTATINIVFDPATVGNKAATLTVVSNDPDTPNAVIALGGVANDPGNGPNIVVNPGRLIFTDAAGGAASPAQIVTITNNGNAPLTITNRVIGAHPAPNPRTISAPLQYQMVTPPALPIVLQPNTSVNVNIVLASNNTAGQGGGAGVKLAMFNITSDDPDTPVAAVELRGVVLPNFNGGNSEPSLQRILDALNIPVTVGDNDPATTTIHATAAIASGGPFGEEISAPLFRRAGVNPVTVEVLATFGVNFNPVSRVGWYVAGSPNARNEVFTVNPNTGGNNNHQSLNPLTTGLNSFNPGTATFGLYSFWPPAMFNWTVFSEDGLNTFEPDVAERHKVRVYPLRDASGIVPNAYIVATEEFTSGFDYNDVVYVIRNVEPATLNPGGNINFTNLDWVTLNAQSIPQFDYLNTWLTFHRILNPNPAKPIQVHDRVTLRITNTGTDPLVITNVQFNNNTQWNLPNGENPSVANPMVIQPNAFYDLVVRFIETQGTRGVRIGTMTITSSDPDQPTSVINLAGAFMLADEGGFENTPPQISQSLGFQNNLAYPFNSQYIARGEEVLSFDWRRADPTRPVYARQLAAFHGCCNAEAYFRINGPGGATMRHDNTQAQTILPLRQATGNPTLPTEMVVYPTGNPFTMTAEGFDSDDCRNVANCRQNGLRFWPVRGPNGVLIPNAYYVIQDYIPGNGCEVNTPGGICDYNDNIYLVTNIEPFTTVTDVAVTITPPTAPATNANLAYIVNTSNVSAFQAANVVTTITIPAGYTIVSAVPTVGTCGAPVNNVVTCNFGTLTGNGQAAVEVIVTTATPGNYTVTAAVTTTTAETELLNNNATNTVTVVAQTTIANTLTIVKQASPDSAQAFQFNTVGAGLTNFQLIDNGGAATPLNVSINFQPAAAPVPANFIADTGAAYGARGGGRTYGWLAEGNDQPINAAINTRDRNRAGIPQELDTMIHMQYAAGGNGGLPNTPIYWEYALPNGTYNVTVSVGDQPGYDSQHRIYVEGQVIPNINPFQANAANEYRQGTISVVVTDGRLTLSAFDNNGQNGGVNTKINYVRISQANQQTFTNLAAGQYTITEVVPANWTLLGATCTGATFVGVQNGVTVTLAGNQNVVCTFNNTSATGAAIALDKTAVTTPINAGGTALFNIVITNIGLVDLNTVTLSDPQCTTGPTRTDAGNNDAQNILSPLESWTYTCAIANAFTDVTNTATVTANPVGGGQAVTATDTATVAVNPLPSISLTKVAENSPVTTGTNALFTLRATNTGNVALTNIILTDALCTTLVQTANGNGDATLDVGEFWTWTCTVNNVTGTSLVNTANVTGTPPAGQPVTANATATALIVQPNQPASITIIKQATPEGATPFAFTSTAPNHANFNIVDNGGAAPAAFQTRINFQQAASAIPAGYVADSGLGYGPRGGGATYGWITQATVGQPNATPIDVANNARDRNRAGIPQELDTIMHMQFTGAPANGNLTPVAWEYLLPNGVYSVTVSVGDQPPYDSFHTINVEGVQFMNRWVAAAGNEYRQVTAVVVVDDGKLTVDAIGGTNTKINYVHITRLQYGANTYTIPGLTAGSSYTITETQQAGWVLNNITCTGANVITPVQNGVTLEVGSSQNPVCTFTNNQVNVQINLVKDVVTTPIASGATANFVLTLTNPGTAPLANVVMTDAQCTTGPTLRAGGDANNNTLLDLNETWVYDCAIANVLTDTTNVATVNASTQDNSVQVTDTDDALVTVIPAPAIAVDKTPATQTIAQGATANFTLTVTNPGNVPLTNIVVTDPLCSAAPVLQPGGDANNDTILQPTETWVYTCATVNVQADFTNTVNVTGTYNAQQLAATDTADVVLTPNPLITVDKTPATQQVPLGGTANFTIVVTNPGNMALGNITIADPLCSAAPVLQPGGDANNDTILQRTETWTYTCSTVNVQDAFTNTVDVSGTPLNGQPVTARDTADVTLIAQPAVAVAKTPLTQVVTQGATANFTLTVTNTGTEPLTNVTVTDPLCSAAPVLQPGGDANNDTILQRTETWVYTCATVNVQADFTNTVNVVATAGAQQVNATANAVVTVVVTPNPQINLVKDADQTVIRGNDAAFTLTVTNPGNVPLSSVVINDPLCNPAPALRAGGDANNNTILEVTETWVYDCVVPNAQQNYTNTATVAATDGTTQVTDTDDAAVVVIEQPVPQINIDKVALLPSYFQGQPAQFTLTVTNPGNVALSNVVITDPLCAPAAALRPGGDANTNTILEVGETWVYDCNVDTTAVPTNQPLVNTAQVAADHNGTPVTDTDDASVTVIPVIAGASIVLDKEAITATVPPSGTAYFYIAVANNGNVDLNTIVVTDPLCAPQPASNGNGDAILSPLEYWVYTCAVPNVLADVINTATVTATDGVNQVTATDTATVTLDTSGGPAIDLSIAPATQTIDPGQTATFTVTVVNNGALALTNANIIAPQPDPIVAVAAVTDCSRTFATLAVGEIQTYVCTAPNVTAAFTNTLTVTALEPGAAATVTDTASANVQLNAPSTNTVNPQPQQPQPGGGQPFVAKSVSNPFAMPGDAVTFTLSVTNPSTVPATGVVLTDPMPEGLSVTGTNATAGNVAVNGRDVSLTLDTLQPGQTVTLTIQSQVAGDAQVPFVINNQACVQAAGQAAPSCSQASILSVTTLPSTGETPLWATLLRLVLMASAALTLSVGLGWSAKRVLRGR